ncbi:MAG: hypothetical protein EP329_09220 [Deltaproteobacteria bacterium]|nr:MAG: hypothetical protein EP329_09220 [Deltaproteobacteria bacterium]
MRAVARLVALVAALGVASGCASTRFFDLSAADDSKTTDTSRSDEGNTSSKEDGSSADSSAVFMGIFTAIGAIALVGSTFAGAEYADAEKYLEQRRRPIRVSLARGAGLFVDDLATALALPAADVPVLGATLQAHQARLDRWLADPEVTREDVVGFSDDLRAALTSEPRLAPVVAAARDRYEGLLGPRR